MITGTSLPRLFRGQNSRISQEEFETRARKKWGDAYKYGKYISMHQYIEVTCPKHGPFLVTPHNHLVDCGCPACSESSGEALVRQQLDKLGMNYISQKRVKLPKPINGISMYILDFVVDYNSKKYIIEYNGVQHYEYVPHFHSGGIIDFEKQKFRDSLLRKLCKTFNIELIEINYKSSDQEVINTLNKTFRNEVQEKTQES